MKVLLSLAIVPGLLLPAAGFAKVIYEPYSVTTIAGWASNQDTVDGPAADAEFANPLGNAVDRHGNLFVAEWWGHVIRKVTPDGFASVYAGKAGEAGSADGDRKDARFSFPEGLAIAADGTIYVGDDYNYTIRKITPDGIVSTLAGSPGLAGYIDGVGSEARFSSPAALAVNQEGEIFVVDTYNNAIRKVTATGEVTTFAGGTRGYKDGTGTDAQFDTPVDITIDGDGNLYVCEAVPNADLRKITPDAVVTTLVTSIYPWGAVSGHDGNIYLGIGTSLIKVLPTGETSDFVGGRWGSEDGFGSEAEFAYPQRLSIDSAGNIYVSDSEGSAIVWPNDVIRKVDPAGFVTTLSGVPVRGSRDAVGLRARFFWAQGLVSDPDGILYIADSYNHTIRKVTPDATVTTIAGKVQTPGDADGVGANARFNYPWALARDPSGNLFIADSGNGLIREMSPALEVTTLAKGHVFLGPTGVAVDLSGNVYVSNTYNQTIEKIDPTGNVILLAGSPGQKGNTDGTGSEARFNDPAGLAVDDAGNLYVADTDNDAIRKISPEAVVTTLAGGLRHGSKDGTGSKAEFRNPAAVALDRAGNVYVSDASNDTLRKITSEGSTTTLAGSPQQGAWADGRGSKARLSNPNGLTIDAAGNVYFADVLNNTIRKAVPRPSHSDQK